MNACSATMGTGFAIKSPRKTKDQLRRLKAEGA
jgi:hypothetical protein